MSWAHRKLHQATWRRARWEAIRRAGYRCERCGRPGRLEVHHRTPLERGGAPFDARNLETLCAICHREQHAAERAAEVPGRAAWREELKRAFS